jgi:hypothetical protein
MKKVLLILSLMFLISLEGQIQKVEPPFWWTSMKMSEIQLLVYGENIAQYSPKIDAEGIKLISVDRVQNDNYIFLNVAIGTEASPGTILIDFYKGNKRKYTHQYQLLERKLNAAQLQGFTPADVMYLITPDRFANGDLQNDEMDGMLEKLGSGDFDRHGGDLQGIIDHLDYLDDLGFTAIWLNPALENNMEKASYHGYSTTDYYRVDPRFGTNKKFKELVDKAAQKEIKIIMDLIPNHCGSEHWFFKDPPTHNWFNHQEGYKNTTHIRESIQGYSCF